MDKQELQKQITLAMLKLEYDQHKLSLMLYNPTEQGLLWLQETYTKLKPYYKDLYDYKELL